MNGPLLQRIDVKVRSAPGLGRDARFYRMACAHGVTTGAFLPGGHALPDHQVIDLLVANHQAARACACLPTRLVA